MSGEYEEMLLHVREKGESYVDSYLKTHNILVKDES